MTDREHKDDPCSTKPTVTAYQRETNAVAGEEVWHPAMPTQGQVAEVESTRCPLGLGKPRDQAKAPETFSQMQLLVLRPHSSLNLVPPMVK